MSRHHRHYKHLHIPETWEQYWLKYPNGYTMLESLIDWVSQVNKMISSFNNLSDEYTTLNRNMRALEKELRASWKGYKDHTEKTYEDFRDEILTIVNQWIATIEPTIQDEVVNSLSSWLDDGTLAEIINEDVFDMKANQIDLEKTSEQLAQLAINVKSFGATGDGVTDDTASIQNAIDFVGDNGGGTVFVPNGTYMIDGVGTGDYWQGKGLLFRSNINFIMAKGTVIKLIPNDKTNTKTLNIVDVENVSVIGGTIQGDRDEHLGTTGEWGRNITINGSKNIVIRDLTTRDSWGDGLIISGSDNKDYSENVSLTNIISDNNRRQGLSVISVKGLYGYNVELKNTNGTAPEAGVDFEPDTDNQILEDIHFTNLKTLNNAGSGVLVYLPNIGTGKKQINMTFDNLISKNNETGVSTMLYNGESDGTIEFNSPFIENVKGAGFNFRGVSSKFSKVVINNPTIIDYNTSGGTRTTNSGISVQRATIDFADDANFKMGNLEVHNPTFNRRTDLSGSASDIIFYDPVVSNEETFEKVTLIGFERQNIYGAHLLIKSFIDLSGLPVYDYWPASENNPDGSFGLSYPPVESVYKEVTFPTNKDTTINLRSLSDDMVFPITFVHRGGNNTLTIQPPENERLYPLKYSASNGKGIYLPPTANAVGSTVTIQRIRGKWTVLEINGEWLVEDKPEQEFSLQTIAHSGISDHVKLKLNFDSLGANVGGYLDLKILGQWGSANRRGYAYYRMYFSGSVVSEEVEIGNIGESNFATVFTFNGVSIEGNSVIIDFTKASGADHRIFISGHMNRGFINHEFV